MRIDYSITRAVQLRSLIFLLFSKCADSRLKVTQSHYNCNRQKLPQLIATYADAPYYFRNSSVYLFADDAKLPLTINSISDCHRLQNEINAAKCFKDIVNNVWFKWSGILLQIWKQLRSHSLSATVFILSKMFHANRSFFLSFFRSLTILSHSFKKHGIKNSEFARWTGDEIEFRFVNHSFRLCVSEIERERQKREQKLHDLIIGWVCNYRLVAFNRCFFVCSSVFL